MSGYDFFSGFLGSLGQQMQDNQRRKQAIEDEDRQYQRALSREEALAKSRERLQIAAEKRQQMRAEPVAYQENQGDKLVQGKRRWNPETQAYDQFGDVTPVPQMDVGKTYNADGFIWQPRNYGGPRKVGRTEDSLDRDSANSRSANSIAAANKRAELAAQAKSSVDPDKEVRSWVSKGINSFRGMSEDKREQFMIDLGLPVGSSEPAIRQALAEQGRRNQEVPAAPVKNGAKTLLEVGADFFGAKAGNKVPDAEAKAIAAARLKYPSAKNYSDADVLEFLKSLQ